MTARLNRHTAYAAFSVVTLIAAPAASDAPGVVRPMPSPGIAFSAPAAPGVIRPEPRRPVAASVCAGLLSQSQQRATVAAEIDEQTTFFQQVPPATDFHQMMRAEQCAALAKPPRVFE